MNDYSRTVQVRWSDLDPNFHIRHSVYYDWGAFCRLEFFNDFGLTAGVLQQLHLGVILLREECVFRREIKSGDNVTIDMKLIKAKRNYSRWSIQHHIYKNVDTVSAVVTVEGAWIDARLRKLISPPDEVLQAFAQLPLAENFEWLDKQKP
ncbi:thioesterase family protein [Paraflavisolibacter sp. H34]|uniref:acyl-CoA thioesterase n=1 Tax=Huijunlia imazamoxiresistens TaxID=3127457 RepID=UPI003017BBA7